MTIQIIKKKGLIPEECSGEIRRTAAGGFVVPFREHELFHRGDKYVLVETPYPNGAPARVGDAFDVMLEQAKRRGGG